MFTSTENTNAKVGKYPIVLHPESTKFIPLVTAGHKKTHFPAKLNLPHLVVDKNKVSTWHRIEWLVARLIKALCDITKGWFQELYYHNHFNHHKFNLLHHSFHTYIHLSDMPIQGKYAPLKTAYLSLCWLPATKTPPFFIFDLWKRTKTKLSFGNHFSCHQFNLLCHHT